MSNAQDVSLYERIEERCNSGSHDFLDLSTSAKTGLIEAPAMLELAKRIAAELTRQAPNHLILIYLDQCSSFIPVMWGCLAARLTALPLSMAANPGRPKPSDLAQLENFLANADSVAVVIDEASAGAQKWMTNLDNVRWLTLSSLLMGSAASNSRSTAEDSNNIAYLLQTSGTTGLYKYAAFSGQAQIQAIHNGRRILTVYPLSSSNGIGFISALNSLSAYLPLHEAMRFPEAILEAVEEYQLDTLMLPPVMVKGLLGYFKGLKASTCKRNLSSLNVLEIGSSTIASFEAEELAEYLEGWGAQRPLIRLVYGLTETGRVAYGILQGADQHKHHVGLRIGPILPGVDVRILTSKSGEPGPIAVKCTSTFLGYLDPKTFKLKSFNTRSDWFHTGDLGLLENGELIISGRSKDIIVVNSRKISLASIEQHIHRLWPDHLEIVVACASWKEELVLFVTQALGQPPLQQNELHRKASDAVNRQFGLSITHLVQLRAAEIPRTNTGKIKKKELLSHWFDQYRNRESPRTALGRQSINVANSSRKSVLELLQELISAKVQAIESSNPDQLLSAIGLDSLSLAQIIGTVERQTGLACRVEECTQNPTLGELAMLFTQNASVIKAENHECSIIDTSILDQYPHREALIHKIQTENLQMGGDIVGPHQVIRRFNSQASGMPIALFANFAREDILLLAKELPDHPIYYLRLSFGYKNSGSRQYLAGCYVDWLEACLPACNPILIGHCMGGNIVRHIAQQLWARPHRPRLTMLMDWYPGREDQMSPYPGKVLYHVYEWHWCRDTTCKDRIQKMANLQTPIAAFYFAKSITGRPKNYIDLNSTIEVLAKILNDPKLEILLD